MIVGGVKKENGGLETMLPLAEYENLHTEPLIALDMLIDCQEFAITMQKYELAFRRWGQDHIDKRRFGLPLINLNGQLSDNPDVSLMPLDVYNRDRKEQLWDNDFITATPALNESCFDVLDPIKPFLIRSCILKWYTDSLFYPHIDTWLHSPIIRLWGTNNPENMSLRFYSKHTRSAVTKTESGQLIQPEISVEEASKDLVRVENVEAGRLYLIDTAITHDAHAHSDKVYQFFIALNSNSYDTIRKLKA